MKQKLSLLFAFVAIVISFAACGGKDGNVPEIKDVTFKVYVLNTRAHITVTPLDNQKLYFWSYVRADELNGQTLQAYVEAYCSKYTSYTTSMGEEKADLIFVDPYTKYILWACYVEKLESGQLKIMGDIVSQEITSKGQHFLENEFSFGPNKRAFFSTCNYIKGDYSDFEQWTYYGKTSSTAGLFNPQDLFTWTEMDQASGIFKGSVPNKGHWWYLFRERDHADERFTLATIHVDFWWWDEKDIHGLIILPDDWQTPDNVTLKTAKDLGLVWNEANNAYEAASSFDGYAQNVFNNTTEWWALEEAGAVFLPAAGATSGNVNSSGFYWSSSEDEEYNTKAYGFMFNKYRLSLDRLIYPLDKTQYSYSVRPVAFIGNSIFYDIQ
jgi:hypothetical protein